MLSKCTLAMADSLCWCPFNFVQNCGQLSLSRHLAHILLENRPTRNLKTPRVFFMFSSNSCSVVRNFPLLWAQSPWSPHSYMSSKICVSSFLVNKQEHILAGEHLATGPCRSRNHQSCTSSPDGKGLTSPCPPGQSTSPERSWDGDIPGATQKLPTYLSTNKVDMISSRRQQTMLLTSWHAKTMSPMLQSNQEGSRRSPRSGGPVNTISWPSLEQNPSPTPQTPGFPSCFIQHLPQEKSTKWELKWIQFGRFSAWENAKCWRKTTHFLPRSSSCNCSIPAWQSPSSQKCTSDGPISGNNFTCVASLWHRHWHTKTRSFICQSLSEGKYQNQWMSDLPRHVL